ATGPGAGRLFFTRSRSLLGIRFLDVRGDRYDAALRAARYRESRGITVAVQVSIGGGRKAARSRVCAGHRVSVHEVLGLIHDELETLPTGGGATGRPIGGLRLVLLSLYGGCCCGDRVCGA